MSLNTTHNTYHKSQLTTLRVTSYKLQPQQEHYQLSRFPSSYSLQKSSDIWRSKMKDFDAVGRICTE